MNAADPTRLRRVPLAYKDAITPFQRVIGAIEIVKATGCWLYRGAIDRHGYGVLNLGGRTRRAHQVTYRVTRGPLPEVGDLDHLCRVPRCCNPWHLEAVSHAENCRRGRAAEVNRALQLAKTHCRQGHPFEGDNVGVSLSGKSTQRRCRECARIRARRAYHAAKSRAGIPSQMVKPWPGWAQHLTPGSR